MRFLVSNFETFWPCTNFLRLVGFVTGFRTFRTCMGLHGFRAVCDITMHWTMCLDEVLRVHNLGALARGRKRFFDGENTMYWLINIQQKCFVLLCTGVAILDHSFVVYSPVLLVLVMITKNWIWSKYSMHWYCTEFWLLCTIWQAGKLVNETTDRCHGINAIEYHNHIQNASCKWAFQSKGIRLRKPVVPFVQFQRLQQSSLETSMAWLER